MTMPNPVRTSGLPAWVVSIRGRRSPTARVAPRRPPGRSRRRGCDSARFSARLPVELRATANRLRACSALVNTAACDLAALERADQALERPGVRRQRPAVGRDLRDLRAARLERAVELDVGAAVALDDDAGSFQVNVLYGFQEFLGRERIRGAAVDAHAARAQRAGGLRAAGGDDGRFQEATRKSAVKRQACPARQKARACRRRSGR